MPRGVVERDEPRPGSDETQIVVSSDGRVGAHEWNHAIDQVQRVVDRIGDPVRGATVRLTRAGDPARERRCTATATIDIDGRPVRSRAEAAEMRDAVDRLVDRLRDRLQHLDELRLALRNRGAEHPPSEWRHGDRPEPRPEYHPRPVDEREVVRRKSFSTPESTLDEAIFDMESLDHDFFLFSDLATGQDAVVWRDGGAYRVRYAGTAPSDAAAAATVVVDTVPVGTATEDDVRARLDVGDEPWVIFRDAGTGRGRVMYRRYDGHYGLITPVTDAA